MSSVETVSGQVAGAAQNGSPSNSTNHSPKASLKKAIGSENKNQDASEGDSAPINLHIDVKPGVTPLEALGPLHVAAASAERYHNGLRDSEAPSKGMLAITSLVAEDKGHPERKRRASSDSLDSSTKASESAADDAKEEDDDNDDDDDDKLQAQDIDPERLKAFNMFVRLFVDENLDRMIPISKQPKDKVQAILEACDRQFPEFHNRSRKRIRTYLKSCRRLRRSKDSNGWDQMRPTPPHLTSAAAETILAIACENEGSNAKRMRMGLEPLPARSMTGASSPPSQALPAGTSPSIPPNSSASMSPPAVPQHHGAQSGLSIQPPATTSAQNSSGCSSGSKTSAPEFLRGSASSSMFRHPHELPSSLFANGNSLLRPNFPSSYQQPARLSPLAHVHFPHSSQNGPTDLSMKKTSSSTTSSKPHQLNQSEVSTIKQLIAGYRESAAFLYRSADELEQLLLQQN